MGVDAARLDVALVAPDALQQPVAGEHASRAFDHVAEELELLVGEPDLLAAVARDVGVELHLEVLVAVALGRFSRRAGPAQGHSAARGQLLQAERLHQVVVGPHLEPEHAVHLVRPGRHNDDGHVGRGGLAPEHPADLQPVHARQVQVEEHEVGPAPHRLQPLLARAGDLDLEPHFLELIADGLRDVAVVLDEHDSPPAVRRGGGGADAASQTFSLHSSTPHPIPPHVGGGKRSSTSGPAIHLVSASRWWWRTSLASTRKITSSAMLVAWSAMRSMLRLIRIRERARWMVPGSAIM